MTVDEAVAMLPRRKMLSYRLDGETVNTVLLAEKEIEQIASLLQQQQQQIERAEKVCRAAEPFNESTYATMAEKFEILDKALAEWRGK